MCKVDYYIDVYPDGSEKRSSRLEPCSASRPYTCQDPETFHHPRTYVPYPVAGAHYPPSPRLTPSGSPRLDSPFVYYSNSESDRSRRNSASRSDRRRESSLYISSSPRGIEVSHSRSPASGSRYLHPHDTHDRHRRSSRYRLSTTEPQRPGERVVIVENPPTPRTPPQNFSAPFTAPNSPLNGFLSSTPPSGSFSARRSSRRLQPVIVDERPRVRFSPSLDEDPPSRYRDPELVTTAEDRPRRRREPAATTADDNNNDATAATPSDKEKEKAEKIARLNDRINARPAVPIPIPAPKTTLRRSATDFAPVVDDRDYSRDHDRGLSDAIRQLDLGDRMPRRSGTMAAGPSSPSQQQRESRRDLYDRYGRRYLDEEDEEEEARQRRLAERMMPRRRATVGPGARRHHIRYDDGMYRWE